MHIQKKLFTPIQIGPITLKHRVVMPPMSRFRAQWPSGIPSDLQLAYYRQRASGGGLIFTEATAISTSGRGYKGVTTPNVKNSTLRPTSHRCAAANGLESPELPLRAAWLSATCSPR
jgi:2,4-dienoyl-CoA reductase-like NADH-dependent reductase (Old Yellow Enzyme family)